MSLADPIRDQIEAAIEDVLAQAPDVTMYAVFLSAFALEVRKRQIDLAGAESVAAGLHAEWMRLTGQWPSPP